MENEIDRKIDVTAILFLLVQNRQQTHDWTLIGSGANGLGILEWRDWIQIEETERILLWLFQGKSLLVYNKTGLWAALLRHM